MIKWAYAGVALLVAVSYFYVRGHIVQPIMFMEIENSNFPVNLLLLFLFTGLVADKLGKGKPKRTANLIFAGMLGAVLLIALVITR